MSTQKQWTAESIRKTMRTHSNPSTLEGFVRKEYCGKGAADLQVGDGAREFIAKITTNTRDRDNEIMNPKGGDFSNYLKNPIILWAHDYTEPAIGRAQWMKRWSENRKARGVIAKGIVAEDVARAEEVYRLMQQRILNTVSVGFISIKGHEPTPDEVKRVPELSEIRYIHDGWAMLEYSVVNVPSNPEATIDAVSKGTIEISAAMQSELGIYIPANTPAPFVKKAVPYAQTPQDGIDAGWSLDEEKRNADIEGLGIMAAWADSQNPESKTSYKLIHHRSTPPNALVWVGLTQAMSKLNRFAVQIPELDRTAVWSHLAKHYREFGMEPPELKAEPDKFALASFDLASVKTHDVINTIDPIKAQEIEIPVNEIPEAKGGKTPQEIAADAVDSLERNVLGRV